jgi:hypothetical protein
VHVGADLLDAPGDVDTGDSGLRFGQADAAHQAGDARVTAQPVPVVGVDRGGVHLEKHITGTDIGSVGTHQSKGVRWAETVLHDCFHQLSQAAISDAFFLARHISTPSLQTTFGWVHGVYASHEMVTTRNRASYPATSLALGTG